MMLLIGWVLMFAGVTASVWSAYTGWVLIGALDKHVKPGGRR